MDYTSKELTAFLFDLGRGLKEDALEAKQLVLTAGETDKDFYEGKLLGYHEVLSFLLNQARAFQIDAEVIGLKDFNPDKDL